MAKAKKFGAFGGVFTPSILTILGVIMYLRLPWIVGQAGLWATLGIILVAHIISASTGLSVASIATDKKVESGGTYYIISRSLGLPIGGTLGWALFVGLSFSVSLYLIGFSEVFLGYFGFDVTLNNIRIAGSVILLIVTILTFISTSLAIKTQYIILTAMVLSLVSVFLGNHSYAPAAPQLDTLPNSLPWIALFAIFFPAATGFEAGVSMSGDLKDPKKAIPRGTIGAILVGLITYVGLAFYFSYTVDREALVNDPNILFSISWLPQLVIAGILGATFSSALGSILSAPRILQAVAKDRIAPRFFSKGHGPSNEPHNAILLTFVIALGGILIGELNVIARVVTTFFIITYGFLNITYTVESWASSDFRPSFRIPRFVSVVGAIACIVVMIQLDIMAMIGASLILLSLFMVLRRQELNLQSGDTWNSVWMSIVKHGLKKLTKREVHNRNWRPNVILMSGGAAARPHLIEMGEALVGRQGVFTNFELEEADDPEAVESPVERVRVEKLTNHPEIITRKYRCKSIYEGIDMISRVYGFSGFEPDTILMGWPKATADPQRMNQLLHTLHLRDFNIALLDFNSSTGFGDYATIDFWWSGSGRELTLALHLMRFISSRKEWRKARLRVLAVNSDATLTERYYSILNQMIDNYRLSVEVKVLTVAVGTSVDETIAGESAATSLTMMALPELTTASSVQLIENATRLSSRLNNCLWLKASGNFEWVDVVPESYHAGTKPIESADEQKLCESLDVSSATRDAQELMAFATKEEQELELLNQQLFTELEQRRNAVLDTLIQASTDTGRWQGVVAQQKTEELADEEALLQKSLIAFMDGVQANVRALLQQLHLKPGRKDSKAMEVAVYYHLYSRRVDSIEKMMTGMLLHAVHFMDAIREVFLYVQSEMNGTADTRNTGDLLSKLSEQQGAELRQLYTRLVDEFRQDIALLSQLLDGQRMSEMYPGLKKLNQKKAEKLIQLEDAPGRIRHFMTLQWDKLLLDVVCLDTRQAVTQQVQVLQSDLHTLLQEVLYDRLEQSAAALAGEKFGAGDLPAESVLLPSPELAFTQLMNKILEIVDGVPQQLVVAANQLPENLSLETVEHVGELEINARAIQEYFIVKELGNRINTQSGRFTKEVQRVAAALQNILRLANYHRSQQSADTDHRVFPDLKANVEKERERLQQLEKELQMHFEDGLNKAFASLNAVELVNHAGRPGSRLTTRSSHGTVQHALLQWFDARVKQFVEAVVSLFYHQSKGVLWTKRQELAGERAALYPGDILKRYAEKHQPDSEVLARLPYYYVNLFTDDAGASQEFRVIMQEETVRGMKAVKEFHAGRPGLLVITGDRGSGKSSLARYLAESNFDKSAIWKIRPPLECSADLHYFEEQLKEYATGKGSFERRMDRVQGKRVVLVDDLELWWERRPGGDRVINRLLELVQQYGRQLLVVVSVNRHSLRILEQLTQLNSWVNELIYCQPFDAGELRDMILTRHQAGGMKFILDEEEEDQLSNWTYAQYFNHLFNCSGGNPGLAVQLWLAGIRSVEGAVMKIERPLQEELPAAGHLTEKEWMIVVQLVLHRRFSAAALSQLMQWEVETTALMLRQLLRNGVIRESSSGVYTLELPIEQQLITHLKTMTYL